MTRNLNLTNDGIRRLYLAYLGPGVLGTVVASFYVLADTIFIGRTMGSAGLAALDLTLPIYNVFIALGLLLGVGAATTYGISGAKNKSVISLAVTCGLFCSLLAVLVGVFWLEETVALLGAKGDLIVHTQEYVGPLLVLGPFFILSTLLAPLVSIDRAPELPMWALIAGSLVNLILDLLFIYILQWGMKGAALATGLAAGVNLWILLSHFYSPKSTLELSFRAIRFKNLVNVILNGFPSFISELAAGIAILLFNQKLLLLSGEVGVAAYAIIANIAIVCASIFTGIGQAIQPLISLNYGVGKWKRVVKIRNLSLLTASVASLIIFSLGQGLSELIVGVFITADFELINLTVTGLRIFFWALLPMGLNVALGAYFQAMEFPSHAILIALARGSIFVILGLFLLPKLFGLTGVWLVLPVAEALALLLTIYLALKRN